MSDLRAAAESRIATLSATGVPGRIWERDHTLWGPEPNEIADRLGWLTVHDEMRGRAGELADFARGCASDGLRWAVLAGMGGSSLAPEVFAASFGAGKGLLELVVLDTTHPDQILFTLRSLDLRETLFVIASKSGTTAETRSHFQYFWEQVPDGSRYVAITDPGTPLAALAEERGFRRAFLNPPDIGGRYSALSFFGLVPAALAGVDLEPLLSGANEMAEACKAPAGENPGAQLGAWMGEGATLGRDKLTFAMPEKVASFGWWIEQLVAESTGKRGTGIVPVEGEALGPPGVYGDDRLLVTLGRAGDGPIVGWLERSGTPVLRLPLDHVVDLGAEMFRWEFATAVAGAVLHVNPFDQPDVQSAKDATNRVLSSGSVPEVEPGDLGELIGSVRPGDYVAIQAYVPRNAQDAARLHAVRQRIRDELRVATTVGFGPRFLHSTGQLHKGGPNTVACIQVVDPPAEDLAIPGEAFTFGTLLAAQAAGDLEALRARGRRAVRVSLEALEAAKWN